MTCVNYQNFDNVKANANIQNPFELYVNNLFDAL